MRFIPKILIFLGIIILNTNCTYDVYHRKSKNKQISRKYYSFSDTLFIKNYAVYNSREEMLLIPNNKPFEVNKGSIKNIVFESFKELKIENFKISVGENNIDSLHYKTPAIRMRHIDEAFLKCLIKHGEKDLILIPIIYAYNQYTFTGFISSGGISGNNGWNTMTWLSLLVYVFKENKVIYSRQIRYKSERIWADSRDEILSVPPLAAVKQEHWDELVRLAMKDYIKRLK